MTSEGNQGPRNANFPNFSEELARSIYTESIESPHSSLVATAEHMNKDNPAVMDFFIEKSFSYIAGGYSRKTALALFEGASFIYRFFDQDAIDHKTDVRRIGKSIINRWEKEDTRLKNRYQNARTQNVQQSAYATYRERGLRVFRRMKNNSPALDLAQSTKLEATKITEDEKTLFLVGVVEMYEFFEQAYQQPMPSHEIEPIRESVPNKPPVVRADIARMGMALILIDQKRFAQDVLGDMKKVVPDLEQFVRRKSAEHPNTDRLQLLLSTYTFYCLNMEYKRLELGFPAISKKTIDDHNARANREYFKTRSMDRATRRVLEPADTLRLENNEFNDRAMILLQTYAKHGEEEKFGAVFGGIFTVFMPLQEHLATVGKD